MNPCKGRLDSEHFDYTLLPSEHAEHLPPVSVGQLTWTVFQGTRIITRQGKETRLIQLHRA